eukprot:UN2664
MFVCGRALRRFPLNYFLMGAFTACIGVMVGCISATHSEHTVVMAACTTGGVFLLLTVYAWTTGTDFIGLHPYFMAFLAVVGSFAMCLWAFHWICGIHFPWLHSLMGVLGVVIFSFYVVYDTQRLIGEWGGYKEQISIDDYAYGTLCLYIDVINLFIHILSLFGNRVQ